MPRRPRLRRPRLALWRAVTGALLAVGLLFVAVGPAAGAPTPVVLAVEGGGEDAEPLGPEPMPANATENPAAPTDYESNFLWGAAVGLLVLTVFAVLGVAGLYYLLVVRPRQKQDSTA